MRPCVTMAATLLVGGPAFAGTTFVPGSGEFGTALFEDNWPAAGDFDFNDVVVRFNVEVNDGPGPTSRVLLTLEVQALGAGGVCSGLALRLPGATTAVTSAQLLTGVAGAGEPYTVVGPVDQTDSDGQAVWWLSDDLRADVFSDAPGFLNTVTGGTGVDPVPLVVVAEVSDALGAAIAAAGRPGDLFIHHCGDRSWQIHASGAPGTVEANGALFGTGADASGSGRYYVTAGNIPFGLIIGEGAGPAALGDDSSWPEERHRVDAAWPDIVAFASSHGATNTDFYLPENAVGTAVFGDAAALPLFTYATTPAVDVCPGHVLDARACGYAYTGADVAFVPPADVKAFRVQAWGAGGGGGSTPGGEPNHGGGGGYVDEAALALSGPVTVRVGGGGGITGGTHAFGGGGAGGTHAYGGDASAGGGGGSYVLATASAAIPAHVLVAAGGGGGSGSHGGATPANPGEGGAGGPLGVKGGYGSFASDLASGCFGAAGGSAIAGGLGANPNPAVSTDDGSLLRGGDAGAGSPAYYAGGGGGGWFGGGGGGCHSGGGGGSNKPPVVGTSAAGTGRTPGGAVAELYPGGSVGYGGLPFTAGGHGYVIVRWGETSGSCASDADCAVGTCDPVVLSCTGDADAVCDAGERADSEDCDGACDQGETGPDCDGVCDAFDDAVTVDCPAVSLVPVLSANASAPPIVVSSSTAHWNSDLQPWKAFNKSWSAWQNGFCWDATTGWLQVDFGAPRSVRSYRIRGRDDALSSAPLNWTFAGSNDGSTWTVIDTRSGATSWGLGEHRVYELGEVETWRYFRLTETANNGYALGCFQEMELYGD